MEQLKDNLGAAQIELNEADKKSLNEVSAPEEMYPYRFQDIYCNRNLQPN